MISDLYAFLSGYGSHPGGTPKKHDTELGIRQTIAVTLWLISHGKELLVDSSSGNDNPDQNSNQALESVSVDVYVPTGSTGGFQFWTNMFDSTLASAELGAISTAQMGTDASHGNGVLSSISWQII
jgi:hypothetical protein